MEEKKPLYHNRIEDVVLRYLDEFMAAGGSTISGLELLPAGEYLHSPAGLMIPMSKTF